MNIEAIAHVHTALPDKFGVPRQSGLVPELKGTIEFQREYSNPDAFRELDGYSHIWVIWEFDRSFASAKTESERKWSPTVRPPRLGGNRRVGVFATRSPNRPNSLALSALRLDGIRFENGIVYLDVSGVDMTDGTPVYDIKPYLPNIDSIPEAKGGFALREAGRKLDVVIPDNLLSVLSPDDAEALRGILAEDPRPQYIDDCRSYGMTFGNHEISFTVRESTAYVEKIE